MIRMTEALNSILRTCGTLPVRRVDIREARGLVLAEQAAAGQDIPPFDKAAMDGYAVRSEDLRRGGSLRETGSIQAGEAPGTPLRPGACMRIMTGAPVPAGADAVVMIERTEVSPGGVVFRKPVHPGDNICPRGEDLRSGERVLGPGTVLGAAEIAILASAGLGEASVYSVPRVAVLNTGNELVEPGETTPPGHIPNCNGPLLEALARSELCRVTYLGIAGDRRNVLLRALERGLGHDVLLVSGGVSMGDYDLVPGALRELGVSELFHRVSVKPGKPLYFGNRENCLVFGVPGNPVSNFTTFHVFVKPALRRLRGIPNPPSPVQARLPRTLERRGERAWLVPAVARVREGYLEASPLELNGSADIIGCAGCNAIMVLGEEVQVLPAGSTVSTLLLNGEV